MRKFLWSGPYGCQNRINSFSFPFLWNLMHEKEDGEKSYKLEIAFNSLFGKMLEVKSCLHANQLRYVHLQGSFLIDVWLMYWILWEGKIWLTTIGSRSSQNFDDRTFRLNLAPLWDTIHRENVLWHSNKIIHLSGEPNFSESLTYSRLHTFGERKYG